MCPNLAQRSTIRAAPRATTWQRRRSDGNEEEGRQQAKRWQELCAPRWRQARRQALVGEEERREEGRCQEEWRQEVREEGHEEVERQKAREQAVVGARRGEAWRREEVRGEEVFSQEVGYEVVSQARRREAFGASEVGVSARAREARGVGR